MDRRSVRRCVHLLRRLCGRSGLEENNAVTLELRALDPTTDLLLFETAYNWRRKRKTHIQPDRMSLEDFTSSDPAQIVFGLFNGSLQAVYLLKEYEPKKFEAHFSSDRQAPTENVWAGAKSIIDLMWQNGAQEIAAWIVPRNRPLRAFVEALGFELESMKEFDGRRFTRYVITPR